MHYFREETTSIRRHKMTRPDFGISFSDVLERFISSPALYVHRTGTRTRTQVEQLLCQPHGPSKVCRMFNTVWHSTHIYYWITLISTKFLPLKVLECRAP